MRLIHDLKIGLGILILAMSMSSCRTMYPSIMFKSKETKGGKEQNNIAPVEYIINSGDRLTMQVYSNNGYELVNVIPTNINIAGNNLTEYQVDLSGNAKLPMLDTVFVKGLTTHQTEKILEKAYTQYFKDPFVMIKVTNKRVIVYTGEGKATVVPFENQNMSLIEAIAKAGGLSANGKAYHIKLIRGDLTNPEVRVIDLSTIEGMKQANLVLQANDIIYVEPVIRITTGVLNELTPIIAILTSITSVLLIYNLLIK